MPTLSVKVFSVVGQFAPVTTTVNELTPASCGTPTTVPPAVKDSPCGRVLPSFNEYFNVPSETAVTLCAYCLPHRAVGNTEEANEKSL